ncbi:MAG: polyamine aminopropyltransferase [Rhodospirillaceae bacterium]
MSEQWFSETLHPNWQQTFKAEKVFHRDNTGLQDLVIFENQTYGRVMILDGVIQLTEGDEPAYHEMLVHVPLFGHGAAKRVLIIGGGDGGTLREVLRHQSVASATMVEIDPDVVDFSKTHLPALSKGAFDDPRGQVIIADGIEFMKTSPDQWDVIIIDSTDPFGPAAGLFTADFYGDCRARLGPGGILTLQGGVPFLQGDEAKLIHDNLQAAGFAEATFYLTVVPTYAGGFMTLGWASEDAGLKKPDALTDRVAASGLSFDYYSAEVHEAAFALPPFIRKRAGMA